jgi:hypothetical protein
LKLRIIAFILVLFFRVAYAQDDLRELPKKGSYLYYGQPAFEDNSFLLEEAFNQPKGVHQYIANVAFDYLKGGDYDYAYSFSQEIPLTDKTHQLSYTIFYKMLKEGQTNSEASGLGDFHLSYQPMLWGEKKWAMVIPRFTLILPIGNAKDGLSSGSIGAQFNLAVTKRLSRKIVTHYNGGYTFVPSAQRYEGSLSGGKILTAEKDIHSQNLGTSIIWYPKRKFNLFLEYVCNFVGSIEADGTLLRSHQSIINPGLRFCIDNGFMQIVPGISMPVNFVDGRYDHSTLFLYLSFEPDYLIFYKSKSSK